MSQTAKTDLCSVAIPFMRWTWVECAHMTWSAFFRSKWKDHSLYTCCVESDGEKKNVSLQLCPTLHDPMDCSLPDASVYGILQARILEWAVVPPPGDLPHPEIEPSSLVSHALAGGFFTTVPSSPQLFTDSLWGDSWPHSSRIIRLR